MGSPLNNTVQISTRDLRLDYGELTAVNNLRLDIAAGEIYGLVGPNGAGKTSLLKMLANLITPTYGDLHIAGLDLMQHPGAVQQVVGYMPDLSPVAPELKVWEFLEYFAAAYGLPPGERSRRVNECLDLVDMNEHRNAYGKALSRGMTQKVVLAKTLIPRPQILLLDEPASGMDPLARINLKNILIDLSKLGVTTVISSHILTELEDMCTSVGIMDKGRLLKSGAMVDILQEPDIKVILLSTLDQGDALEQLLNAHELVETLERKGNAFVIRFCGTREQESELLRELVRADIPLDMFRRKESRMEDTLISLVTTVTTGAGGMLNGEELSNA